MKGVTEALRIELANFNIKVALIEPGDVVTGITDNRIVSNMSMNSPYYDQHGRTLAVVQQDEHPGCKSELIAKTILSVIKKRYPSCAYPVGHLLQLLSIPIKSLLPSLLFEKIISSHYRFVDK
jgi:short-subunit dehydrogenase